MNPSEVIILYASQTGNARSVAECVQMEDMPGIFPSEVSLMSLQSWLKDDKDLTRFAGLKNVLLVCSTCGQGDVPDNGVGFLRVMKKLCKDADFVSSAPFKDVNQYCLGLGDTNYDKFCGAMKTQERHLVLLGAKKGMKTVYADDGVDLEKGVTQYRNDVVSAQKSVSSVMCKPEEVAQVPALESTSYSKVEAIPDEPFVSPEIVSFVQNCKEKTSEGPFIKLLPKQAPVSIVRPSQVLKNPSSRLTPYFLSNAEDVITDALQQGLQSPVVWSGCASCVGTDDNGIIGSNTVLNQWQTYKDMLASGPVDCKNTELGYSKDFPLFAPVQVSINEGRNEFGVEPRTFVTAHLDVHEARNMYLDGDAYTSGDCITVFPTNDSDLIDSLDAMWAQQGFSRDALLLTSTILETEQVSLSDTGRLAPLTATHEHLPKITTVEQMLSPSQNRLPLTLRDQLLHHIDLHAPLKRSVLRPLLESCVHPYDLAKGLFQFSKAQKDTLDSFMAAKPCIIDLLTLFPTLGSNQQILLNTLLDYGAPVIPRSYSLTTSPLDTSLEVTLRVHKGTSDSLPNISDVTYEGAPAKRAATYMCTGPRNYNGMCGYWQKYVGSKLSKMHGSSFACLKDLAERAKIDGVLLKYSTKQRSDAQNIQCTVGGRVLYLEYYMPFCFHASPQFYLPLQDKTAFPGHIPLLLLGVGTGITPLLGFIRHKFALVQKHVKESPGLQYPYVLHNSCIVRSYYDLQHVPVDLCSTDSLRSEFSNLLVHRNTPGAQVVENRNMAAGNLLPDVGIGNIHVYTGNMHRLVDVLYIRELLAYCELGIINSVSFACSREHDSNTPIVNPVGQRSDKVYAGDLLACDSANVASVIAHGGQIFLCGGSNGLVKSVQQVLEASLESALLTPALTNVTTPLHGHKDIDFIQTFKNNRHNPELRNAVFNADGSFTIPPVAVTNNVFDVFTNTTYDKQISLGLNDPQNNASQWAKLVLMRMIAENKYKRDLWG